MVDSKRKKQTFPLREKPIIIGRSKKAHIAISDDLTSSQHMMIFIEDGCVYIEDLKSKNGIFLNGIKIFKQRMYLDDKVKLGDTLLYFEHKKMDDESLNFLTSDDNTRLVSNDLTLEVETHKERTRLIKNVSKNFAKDSKFYAGVDENVEKLSGASGFKLMLFGYIALLIDLIFSLIFAGITFVAAKMALPDFYTNAMRGVKSASDLFQGEALYLSIVSIFVCFIVFKINRSLKKGSLGEKILKLD